MTKAEMYTHLQGLPNYGGISEAAAIEETNAAGDNLYRLSVRVIDGLKIDYQHLYFWVVDDAGPSEAAYYRSAESIPLIP